MKAKIILLAFSLFLLGGSAWTQHGNLHSSGTELSPTDKSNHKASDLKSFFKNGAASGHIRNFFMTTINQGDLLDYWANGAGGALAYHTADWHGVHLGVKGIFTYNTASSDLNQIDTRAGRSAKWEKELFDLTDSHNVKDLDRLEELYLKYRWGKKSYAEIGKIDINNTPLINRRDGRMKPFVFRGVSTEMYLKKGHKLNLALLNGVSPRGMTEWFSLEEAIGLTNNGYQPDGQHAQYHEHLHTRAIGFIGYEKEFFNGLSFQFWDFYFDRMANINWLELDYGLKGWHTGFQFAHERSLAYQKELAYENRYMQPGEKGNVVSIEAGYGREKKFGGSVSFLHAFDSGRFLFPKEFGRDRFFTSIQRSRFDGLGDANVMTLRGHFKPQEKVHGLKLELAYTLVLGPKRADFTFNKYNNQPYQQFNAKLKYQFSKLLKGLDLELLYIKNQALKGGDTQPEAIFNYYNFNQLNFITNINF